MMDRIEQQNTQSGSKVLKRTIQFVISILSIFSILSYSSWHPIFVNSFNGYFSIFSFHLVSYTIDRKYMFLLCNGILVFLARNFEFFTSSPIIVDFHDKLDTTSNIDDEFVVMRNEEVLMVEEGHKASVKEEENGVLINEADEDKRVLIVEEQESKDQKQETQEEQEQQEEEEHEEQEQDQEEEEHEKQQEEEHEEQEEEEKGDREGEEANGVLSAEELDKRFDEFIKKMKEAIRVEAQQQLVVA